MFDQAFVDELDGKKHDPRAALKEALSRKEISQEEMDALFLDA